MKGSRGSQCARRKDFTVMLISDWSHAAMLQLNPPKEQTLPSKFKPKRALATFRSFGASPCRCSRPSQTPGCQGLNSSLAGSARGSIRCLTSQLPCSRIPARSSKGRPGCSFFSEQQRLKIASAEIETQTHFSKHAFLHST